MPSTFGAVTPRAERTTSPGIALADDAEVALELAADHLVDEAVGRGVPDVQGVDVASVAKHGDPVADGEDLRQPVRDVDDRQSSVGQAPEHLEQVVGLGGREGRGRLVEDEDAGLAGHGPGDLDELAERDRQARDRLVQVDVDTDLPQRLAGVLLELPGADHPVPGREGAEHDVLGHGHLRHQAQLLVHQGDARAERRAGAALDRRAVDLDDTLVRRQDPGEDPHGGGLAGAVLAHEGVDLARPHREADVVDGHGSAEALGDRVGFDDHRRDGRGSRSRHEALPSRSGKVGVIGTTCGRRHDQRLYSRTAHLGTPETEKCSARENTVTSSGARRRLGAAARRGRRRGRPRRRAGRSGSARRGAGPGSGSGAAARGRRADDRATGACLAPADRCGTRPLPRA